MMLRTILRSFLILAVIGLAGCAGAGGGNNTIQLKPGRWAGQGVGVAYTLQFSIVEGSNSLELNSYMIPCGGKLIGVLPTEPIRVPINNDSFTFNGPNTVISGKFTDTTHLRGTWSVTAHKLGADDCPASTGVWAGGPSQ